MAKKEVERQPSMRDLLNASKRINNNIAGIPHDDADDEGGSHNSKLKVAELKEALDAAGIAYTADDKKADLVALLDAA